MASGFNFLEPCDPATKDNEQNVERYRGQGEQSNRQIACKDNGDKETSLHQRRQLPQKVVIYTWVATPFLAGVSCHNFNYQTLYQFIRPLGLLFPAPGGALLVREGGCLSRSRLRGRRNISHRFSLCASSPAELLRTGQPFGAPRLPVRRRFAVRRCRSSVPTAGQLPPRPLLPRLVQ